VRLTLKAVNEELARQGYAARLAKPGDYFYLQCFEAEDWLDRTVNAETVGSRTVQEWINEFHRLKKLNEQIMRQPAPKKQERSDARRQADTSTTQNNVEYFELLSKIRHLPKRLQT
jgi:hypothetical protein